MFLRPLPTKGGRLRLSRSNPLHKMDRTLGDGLEWTLRRHHRRRLAKVGWGGAFEPGPEPWANGHTPVRAGNDLHVLIDGEETFKAIIEAVRSARTFVHIAAWHMEYDFMLSKDSKATLEDLLIEAGNRVEVRILLWGGAPLPPPFRPRRGEAKELAERFSRHAGVQLAIDSKERLLHCHHEKIMVIDGDLAFVGGLDFTTLGASRLDSSHHPPRQPMGWHDAAFEIRGALVADVAQHFATRWHDVTGKSLDVSPVPQAAGDVEAQLVRTVPEKIYDTLPEGDFSLLASYIKALRDAQKFIYIENQFLWSSEIVRILADKLRNPPSDDFRLLVLLPSKPSTGKDDTLGQLAVLAEADQGGERFLACTLYGRDGKETCPVYIHAKIGIVDDEWLTIGSGNLNNHSLFNDSEVNVVTRNSDLASNTRLRLWAEHLELPPEQVDGDPVEVIDKLWQPIALEQLERRETGEPMTRRVTRLPHVSKRSKRLLGPLQTFLVDG
ncbi:phospholipase D-like domain-containing protein [soil metagenome]